MENKILDNLNKLTKLAFMRDWDKSEVYRILAKDTEEMKELKVKIKSELEKIYNTKEFFVEVTDNYISVYIVKGTNQFTLQKRVFSDNFYKLPFGYVMGKKLSKKAMQETLKNM